MESDSEADFEGRRDDTMNLEFEKMQRVLVSAGFREGASAGKDEAFQSGFDAGYAEGFKNAFALGKFNGALEALRRNAQPLSLDMQELEGSNFENTRHGLCLVCKESSEKSAREESCGQSSCSCKNAKDISQITNHQRDIVKEVLEKQKAKCLPVFEKAGVNTLMLEDQE